MNSLRRLWPYLRPYWRLVLVAPSLMVLEVAMDLTQPYLIRRIVDVGIANGDLGVILRTGALMIGAALVGAVGGVGCTVYAVRASMRFGADLRGALYRHVQTLSFANFDRLGTGQLITRLTSDVTQVQEIVLMALRVMVRSPLIMLGSMVMAIITSPTLAVLFLMLIPPLVAIVYFVLVRSYPLYQRMQQDLDRLNTVMQENLAGVRVVKAFVRADHETARFDERNSGLVGSSIRALEFSATVTPVMELVLNLGVAGVIWWGGQGAVNGDISLGEIIAFVNYLRQTLFSLVMVSMLFARLSRAQASADRVVEVLDSVPEVQERPQA
ncbi:MAG: ABC transporter ATP-binding protein, partial [Anaerolineae bacterium]|nr:ABC transporter ATP-binding protein [Anaerolineae bacterium]